VTAPLAAGPNSMLDEGAKVVRGVEDVLDLLHDAGERPRVDREGAGAALDPVARDVLAAIGDGHDTLTELERIGLPPGEAIGAIIALELAGRVVRAPDGRLVPAPR
jgi:predicted Rossmann fold nucleotide-binding protein DprA/Smf involved in DNA uptake